MTETDRDTYEEIYYRLWEMAQRYRSFCQFRVIGNSHDERMIPMLEIGKGTEPIFAVAGLDGTERQLPGLCVSMTENYCRSYESSWMLDGFYDMRKLLDHTRICLIPLLNPDGYEICRNGFGSIRNPIFRQMLRMQEIPSEEFSYNARDVDVRRNFPVEGEQGRFYGCRAESENETRALIRVIQEYKGQGMFVFYQTEEGTIQCSGMDKGMRGKLARGMAARIRRNVEVQCGIYRTTLIGIRRNHGVQYKEWGNRMVTPEQYYSQTIRKCAFRIRINPEREMDLKEMECIVPEYLFLLSGQ